MYNQKKWRDILITDLHCHILPGIDDGASSVEEAEKLLLDQAAQGVRQITFTPHFYAEKNTVDSFLSQRGAALDKIKEICTQNGISYSIGAEVYMSMRLLDMDIDLLRLENTDYMLLEWRFDCYPLWGKEIIKKCMSLGIRPIFAHIERYDYFWNDTARLSEYIDKGALCQINAETLLNKKLKKRAYHLIKRGYVHIVSSDCHNIDKRPPKLGEAYGDIVKKLGQSKAEKLLDNANKVFNGNNVKAVYKKHLFKKF